uniref:Uncharacterized protein n=1 Tax=Anguilla anguilla TaxID=7936 RepID=A0A0E9VQ92_ANGAN
MKIVWLAKLNSFLYLNLDMWH